VPHIVELLEFNKPNSAVAKAIENSNFEELIEAVKAEKRALGVAENLLESDDLIKSLRMVNKIKIGEKIAEFMKYLGKAFKRLSKFKI